MILIPLVCIIPNVRKFAGKLCMNLAITRALCGFHGMNLIITELHGLVMCQQRESA